MSEKKISDIILDLESKIDYILESIKNIDFTNKLILSKLSKNNLYVEKIDTSNQFTFNKKNESGLDSVDQPNPSHVKTDIKQADQVVFKDADEQVVFKDVDEIVETKKTRKSGKITVEQFVSYPDGTKAVLVNVEIFNASNSLIKKSKTNSGGKWTALLDSGKYLIKLTKAPVNGKPAIQKQFEIDVVSNEQNIMELSSP